MTKGSSRNSKRETDVPILVMTDPVRHRTALIVSHFRVRFFPLSTHRMTNSQRLAIVRACLNHWLHEQGKTGNPILRESILIRNDFYCGRRFHGSHFRAVWFIEEDQLKIYDADGEIVAVFTGDEIDSACQSEPKILKLPEPNDETEIRRAA